jgi:hypothetical protein
MNKEILHWFMSPNGLLVTCIFLGYWLAFYLKAKARLESTLLEEGSLPLIQDIMLFRKIERTWANQSITNWELREELGLIGDELQNRKRTRFVSNVCGEDVALFVEGPVIKLKVRQLRTKRSIEYALHLIMTPGMCRDLGFRPRLEFMD